MRRPLRLLLFLLLPPLVLQGCDQRADLPPHALASDQGTLVAIAPMLRDRAAHSATLLPDGTVLLAGGMGEGPADLSTERFDPVTETFRPAGPMVIPRLSHTASRLPDGSVLFTGGYDRAGNYLAEAERFDPTTGRFVPAGSMTTARADHRAITLDDGRILLVGGVGTGWTFLASAEIYTPATGQFVATGGMRLPRESHAAVRLADGRVYVVGGHRGRRESIELFTSAEIYDPATGLFGPAGAMMTRRHKHDALLLPDSTVLITGGTDERDNRGIYSSSEFFDPRTGGYRIGPSLQVPRYKHQGASLLLRDGSVLLSGGATTAERFDPLQDAFLPVGGTARMRGQFSASVLLPDGRVLVTGGYGEGDGSGRGAWLYFP